MFGGAGLAAGITVGALLAQQMLGTDAYAGLPAAMFTMGSAVAAFFVRKLSQKYGRRVGLAGRFYSRWVRGYWVVMAALKIVLFFTSFFTHIWRGYSYEFTSALCRNGFSE